jgi:stage IV sporulation protein FB
MRDPFYYSMPFGRMFGITIRVHWLFPFVALGMILKEAYKSKDAISGAWIDVAMMLAALFFAVLLHEFGHCFGARHVNGDASEVLLWPLGGLANVDIPNTPRAHFLTAAAGPLVNLLLCLLCAGILPFLHDQALRPPWNPLEFPGRNSDGMIDLWPWFGSSAVSVSTYSAAAWVARFFYVNYILFLINVLLIGFPLDGGRMFQSVLWGYVGYRQATFAAIIAGFITVFIVGVWGIVSDSVLPLCLAAFIYLSCKHQYLVLETGGDESVFGYDFSQGYTSLEREGAPDAVQTNPRPVQPKLSWWQRWKQARAAKRMQRETEQREADERRFDSLLEKITVQGKGSLTEEELRFMKQYSDKYKNRK